jgi:preprotein translocase subunit SecA
MDTVLSAQWRMLSQQKTCAPPPQGLDRLWHRGAGLVGRLSRGSSLYIRQAESVLVLEKAYRHVSDRNLRQRIAALSSRYRLGRNNKVDRVLAFVILREVASRTVGMRPYPVQVAGALALYDGCIVEMATGEGKTLVATLPAVLAGWRRRGCHVITANDYLAERDADLMSAIYRFCGLTVGCVTAGMAPRQRKAAYNADVTYCTGKEVAADFLRDRLIGSDFRGLPGLILSKMSGGHEDRFGRMVQRGLEYAIVDEADSILIDGASTPLLISGDGPNQAHIEAYEQAAGLVAGLDPSTDFRVSRDHPDVCLTAKGKERLAELAEPLGGLWAGARRREELILQALVANAMYVRGKHYVVEDDKVVIVDENTGRLMPDRTWRNGLHQAIEAKEGVSVNLPKETFARISFQRFFRLYRKLSGMSGTVAEVREELWDIYQTAVISIPTHRLCRRFLSPDRIFATAASKWDAVEEEICAVHQTGRPILVGTGSIGDSERLSERLTARGLDHHLLNAVKHASEARIIANAGRRRQITVSTNMAGRGTDIKLGPDVAELGGLHVIATERFSARRIDRQLSGRCARHGDPGSHVVFVSLEDELIDQDSRIIVGTLRRWFGRKDRECYSAHWRWLIEAIQKSAERRSFRMRRNVMAADNWLDRNLGFTVNES